MSKRSFLFASALILILGVVVFVMTFRSTSSLYPVPVGTKTTVAPQNLDTFISAASYTCDGGKNISARYLDGPAATSTPALGEPPVPSGAVELIMNGSNLRMVRLKQTLSADGARYANSDESLIFWNKGNGALVLEDGKEKDFTNCVGTPLKVTPASTSTTPKVVPVVPPLLPVPSR